MLCGPASSAGWLWGKVINNRVSPGITDQIQIWIFINNTGEIFLGVPAVTKDYDILLRSKRGHDLRHHGCGNRAMPDGQGWILFKMRKAREMLFIDLSNPSPEPPRVKNGAIISRKQDGRLHGLGLNRASATAREYGGQLTYGYDGGVFTASISFLGGVKGKAK